MLEKYGFEILSLHRDKPKKNSWAYRPIVGLIRMLNRFQSEERKRERWTGELQSDEVLLGGNTLIIHAVTASARFSASGCLSYFVYSNLQSRF